MAKQNRQSEITEIAEKADKIQAGGIECPPEEGAKTPDKFYWLKLDHIKTDHAADTVRIRNALEALGFQCTLQQAYELWLAYSVKHNEDDPANPLNNWFPLPDNFDGVISKLKFNIVPEFGGVKL